VLQVEQSIHVGVWKVDKKRVSASIALRVLKLLKQYFRVLKIPAIEAFDAVKGIGHHLPQHRHAHKPLSIYN